MHEIDATKRTHTAKLRIGKKYIHLETLLDNAVPYVVNPDGTLTERGIALQISVEVGAELIALRTQYTAKMFDYRDVNRPQAAVSAMQEIWKTTDKYMRAFQQGIKNNPNIELIAADFVNLEIHIDSPTHTPVPAPIYPPIADFYKFVKGGIAMAKLSLPDDAAALARKAIEYRQGVTIEYGYSMSDTEKPENMLIETFTKLHIIVHPPDDIAKGSVLHIRCRFTTLSGKHGPWNQWQQCFLAF